MRVGRVMTVTEPSKAHPTQWETTAVGKCILKLLDFDREATFVTDLDSDAVLICRSLTEFMLMLCILPLLPDSFSRPSAQLLKILFELLLLLLFLLCRPFLPFPV